MLIDCHTHAFPDKIAKRAVDTLALKSGGLVPNYDGTVKGLSEIMERDGVDKAFVLNIATNAHQMTSVNNFAASINSDKFISFGSVYPDAPNVLEELERIKSLGLVGVKFHPEYQRFFVDDEKMRPIYKKIGELGLVTVFHAGGDIGYRPPYHCVPQNALNALKMFDSPVVFAHWGGYILYFDVLKYLCGTDAYFDVSFGYGVIPMGTASDIIEKHGVDKILFGSDGPWHSPREEKRLIEVLGLSENDKAKIYYKNALNLIGKNPD